MELALTEAGSALRKSGECLVVRRRDNSTVEIPAEDVSEIFIAGTGISVSSDAFELAIAHEIPFAFLTRSGEPYASVSSPKWTRRAALRLAQLRALDNGRGNAIAMAVTVAKLRNQACTLRYFSKSRKSSAPAIHDRLHELANEIGRIETSARDVSDGPLDDARVRLMSLEAQGARMYWSGVAEILPETVAFPGRKRRGARDPVNASLNYGYGILYAKVSAVLEVVGLDPHTGYLHAIRDGAAALTFDFTEIWRQVVVDRPVLGLLTRRWLPELDSEGAMAWESRREIARKVLERLEARLTSDGASWRISDVMKQQAYDLARTVDTGAPFEGYAGSW